MNNTVTMDKKIKFALIVDSALLFIILLGLIFSPGNRSRQGSQKTLITLDRVTEIKYSGGLQLDIKKQGSNWIFERNGAALPVNSARVEAFIKNMQKPAKLTPVGKTQDAIKTYKLTEQDRILVELSNASKRQSFYLSPIMDTGVCYIMFVGNSVVYKAETQAASYLMGSETDWLDLKILTNIAVKDVQRFSIQGKLEKDSIQGTFVRNAQGWIYEKKPDLAVSRVESWLYSIVSLSAENYMETLTLPAQKEALLITLELGNGTTKNIRVYTIENSNDYIVYSSDRLYPMRCSQYQIENLLKTADELK